MKKPRFIRAFLKDMQTPWPGKAIIIAAYLIGILLPSAMLFALIKITIELYGK